MSVAIGVIGTGVMGSEHARILREETGDAHLAAVCDADEGRARAAGAGSKMFTDPLALINSDQVDAVVIAAPDAMHGALVLACIEQGKPVLCEKPLALTAAEALQVVEAEVAKGRRLIQVGYMRRFDEPYVEMKRRREAGEIGKPVILHNVHRNPVVPTWFSGPMSVTNAFVHEIDMSRWLLGSEMVSAQVYSGPGGDPLMITMQTDRNEIVSTEVFMNCGYGYHVHSQLVGRNGTIETALPTATIRNFSGQHSAAYPDNWIPRFRSAYATQMNAWVKSVRSGGANDGASAWDGYVTTLLAEQIVAALDTGSSAHFVVGSRPAFYDQHK
ncbi:Gfo/Idh/MocA family protein [Sinorhizobium meliloti]|uniref:Gfo/Idh/MocA family protein n=1 Tax=Rhizobium meliloti TaxID=382 RepID=UPI0002861AD0|nr:Gfo/Idh/MocA family oxidoreductase [Sinorhizobium meliloti]ASP82982.1 gfo/Idh/MocA family oxidoreductase [Sinorhizobium meliloti]MQW18140.1 gfo/Idh/MocA family oxidoreductase [Sinorhizobium meliloti]CCM69723.1 Inositol 2-dehydrogenase 1 [Sinorhizobium meliloti Rm41]